MSRQPPGAQTPTAQGATKPSGAASAASNQGVRRQKKAADEQKSGIKIYPPGSQLIPGLSKYIGKLPADANGERRVATKYDSIGLPLTDRRWFVYHSDHQEFSVVNAYIKTLIQDQLHKSETYTTKSPEQKKELDSMIDNPETWPLDLITGIVNATRELILTPNDSSKVLLIRDFGALENIMQQDRSDRAEADLLQAGKASDGKSYTDEAIAKFIYETEQINKTYTEGVLKAEVYPTNLTQQVDILRTFPEEAEAIGAVNSKLKKLFTTNGELNQNGAIFFDKLKELVKAPDDVLKEVRDVQRPRPFLDKEQQKSRTPSVIVSGKTMGDLLGA
jgi:hypothetical protein